jgi:FkbM family methyltransferase
MTNDASGDRPAPPRVAARLAEILREEGPAGLWSRAVIRYRRRVLRHAHRRRWPVVRSAYGVRLVANWDDTTFRFCATGAYGTFFSGFLDRQARPFCFVDIGANQGLYSMIAARNPQCRHAFAFEPVPQTADLLQGNIAANGAERKITLLRKGVSDRAGEIPIAIPEGHSGAAAIGRTLEGAHTHVIEVIDGAGLAEALSCEAGRFIVKIDVEGHEAAVIAALLSTPIVAQIQAIFYECDERWIDVAQIQADLEAAGFSTFQKVGAGDHYDILASRETL